MRSSAPAGFLRPWYAAGGPRSIPGGRRSRRVLGGAPGTSCWVAAPGIPARAGEPLCGVQSSPCYPTEALVCSRWPPAYAKGMPAPWRCLASAWRRSWPLLRGGSPWGYPFVLEGLYVGRSLAPAGLLRAWYAAGGLRPMPGVCPLPSGAR